MFTPPCFKSFENTIAQIAIYISRASARIDRFSNARRTFFLFKLARFRAISQIYFENLITVLRTVSRCVVWTAAVAKLLRLYASKIMALSDF